MQWMGVIRNETLIPPVYCITQTEEPLSLSIAIQNTLPENEREAIAEFLKNLVGGKTKVILGSRSEETWLHRRTFKDDK